MFGTSSAQRREKDQRPFLMMSNVVGDLLPLESLARVA